jgi:hypothetical protein
MNQKGEAVIFNGICWFHLTSYKLNILIPSNIIKKCQYGINLVEAVIFITPVMMNLRMLMVGGWFEPMMQSLVNTRPNCRANNSRVYYFQQTQLN